MKYQINLVYIFTNIFNSYDFILNHFFTIIDKDDFALIKASLVEIMRSTCLTFVPRTKKEEDYIVFMEYKDQSQTKGFVHRLKY